jgi:methylglutaconyl-CoA hydratase
MASSVARMTTERGIRTEYSAGVARLTLDSPHNRNALSTTMISELLAALADAATDEAVRVVVLSHTGPAFCSGVDLRETAAATTASDPEAPGAAPTGPVGRAQPALPVEALGALLAAVWEHPKPVIARVGGLARAGGLGLIAAADLAVCSEDITFAFAEVRLGLVPAVLSATVLPRITPRAAAELYLTGMPFDGRRAAEIGLVTKAVPAAELDTTVDTYAEALIRGGPGALAATKDLLRRTSAGPDIRASVAELTQLSVRHFTSPEGVEGVSAQREKRDPLWIRR